MANEIVKETLHPDNNDNIDIYPKTSYDQVEGAPNLENGTGTGSLVQKTVSSSGTPYVNEASGSGAIAFGKDTKSKGNTAVTFGQENEARGNCAVSMGLNSEASGDHSLTQGVRNKSIGNRTITFGYQNENKGDQSLVAGQDNVVGKYAQNSFVTGESNNTTSPNVSMLGKGLIATAQGQTLIGKFNKYTDIDSALFIVGNGINTTNRDNAFVVLNDGRVKVYGAPQDPTDIVRLGDLSKLRVSKYRHKLTVTNSSMTYYFVFYASFSTPINTTSLIDSNSIFIIFSYGLNVHTKKVCMCVGYTPGQALTISDDGNLLQFNYSSMTNIFDDVLEI